MVDVDCTRMKRVGRWCDSCSSLLAENPVGEYIMPNTVTVMQTKTRPVMGRPIRVDRALAVRRMFAEGKTYKDIMTHLGISDLKTLWRYKKKYTDEQLEEHRKIAEISNA